MARGKYQRVTPRRHKRAVLLLCLAALLLSAAGGTLAYLVVHTPSVENQFVPASVDCEVHSDYSVKNTGNIDAYIRAAVVANWTDGSGNILPSGPADSESYLSFNDSWTKGTSDGFYYYSAVVTSTGDTKTTAPIVTVGEVPSGYRLRIDVLAEAIQADGMGAENARKAWEIASGNDG